MQIDTMHTQNTTTIKGWNVNNSEASSAGKKYIICWHDIELEFTMYAYLSTVSLGHGDDVDV